MDGAFSPATRSRVLRLSLALLTSFAALGIALAQNDAAPGDSRAELTGKAQAEKLKTAAPYVPNKAQRIMDMVESLFLESPGGWYPSFASVYYGGGFTPGVGYRRFYGDNTSWDVHGGYSFKNYKIVEGGTESKDHLKKRLSFGAKAGWRDATQVAYYGLGMSSLESNQTSFRFQETYGDGHAVYRPINWVVITGSVGYEHWKLMEGQGSEPTVSSKFNPTTAPGLGTGNPDYIHSAISTGIDWRTSPGYSRKGGLYQATLEDYHTSTTGLDSFQKLTGEVIQYVPLLRETWVLAGRAKVETTLNDNKLVPIYLLPTLGSVNDLRAYDAQRFHDRHSMLMNAEVRWMPAVGLDMAAFYDAGKVASKRNDLSFKKLKSDVGVGVRFHGILATVLRVEFAVGSDGWKLVFASGPIF